MPQYSTYHLRTQILRQIADYWRLHGYSPTRRELADAIGTTGFTVQYNIYRLAEQGYLTFTPKVARSLQLTAKGRQGYVEQVAR